MSTIGVLAVAAWSFLPMEDWVLRLVLAVGLLAGTWIASGGQAWAGVRLPWKPAIITVLAGVVAVVVPPAEGLAAVLSVMLFYGAIVWLRAIRSTRAIVLPMIVMVAVSALLLVVGVTVFFVASFVLDGVLFPARTARDIVFSDVGTTVFVLISMLGLFYAQIRVNCLIAGRWLRAGVTGPDDPVSADTR